MIICISRGYYNIHMSKKIISKKIILNFNISTGIDIVQYNIYTSKKIILNFNISRGIDIL